MTHDEVKFQRKAVSERRSALDQEIRATYAGHSFKKGDVVYIVSYGYDNNATGVCKIYARKVTLTSLGKVQGTATRVEDGKNTLVRIYREWNILVASMDQVRAIGDKIGAIYSREAILGHLDCKLANFDNLLPAYRAKARAEIARCEALLATDQTFEIVVCGEESQSR